MDKQDLEKKYELLEKLLAFQESTHGKKFTYVSQEGEYRASCDKIKETYQNLCEVGEQLGIYNPVRL